MSCLKSPATSTSRKMSLLLANQRALGQSRAGRSIKTGWSLVPSVIFSLKKQGNRLAAPEEYSLSVGQLEIRDYLYEHHSLWCQGHHAQKYLGKPGEPVRP